MLIVGDRAVNKIKILLQQEKHQGTYFICGVVSIITEHQTGKSQPSYAQEPLMLRNNRQRY